jgi:hypothetical protein
MRMARFEFNGSVHHGIIKDGSVRSGLNVAARLGF